MNFICATKVVLLAVFAQLCSGKQVKDGSGLRGSFRASAGPPRPAILEELEEVLGRSHREETEQQLHDIEEEMNVTFKALAKNDQGAIDAPSVRYALHRFFVQRYGWQVKGLETDGGTWDSASPIQAMGDRVPNEMRELFEERLGRSGLTLHELAVVAATMDRMLHVDVTRQLRNVYRSEDIPEGQPINFEFAKGIMSLYIAKFFLVMPPGMHISAKEVFLPTQHYDVLMQALHNIVPDSPSTSQYSLDLIAKVLASFGELIGHLENQHCQSMKDSLVKLEHRPGSGRVRLGDFFQPRNTNFEFGESVEFLRAAGALDTSNPEDPKVMIPNYLTSSANCLSPSDYFEICCFDECEELMDHIEATLESPVASPKEIISVVSTLSNRSLPAELVDLLQQAARHHGGLVPIHGRIFAQWMHQAYPRQCSHPRSTHDKQQARYKGAALGVDSVASAEEKSKYAKVARAMELLDNQDTLAEEYVPLSIWTMDEQLVSTKAHQTHTRWHSIQEILTHALLGFGGMGAIKLYFFFNARRNSKNMKLI